MNLLDVAEANRITVINNDFIMQKNPFINTSIPDTKCCFNPTLNFLANQKYQKSIVKLSQQECF